MPEPEQYRACFSAAAAGFIFAAKRRRQRSLLEHASALARNPFLRGDHRTIDANGREIEHTHVCGVVISHWVDHPMHLVMITEIENAG